MNCHEQAVILGGIAIRSPIIGLSERNTNIGDELALFVIYLTHAVRETRDHEE